MAISKDQAIGEAIAVLVSQGREVTTTAILSRLHTAGFPKVKPAEIYQSAAWNELRAKEQAKQQSEAPAKEPPAKTAEAEQKTTEKPRPTNVKPVAKTEKKPNFSSKTCPKCGKFIHARTHKHEACGWQMADTAAPAPVVAIEEKAKKRGRPKTGRPAFTAGGFTLAEIQAAGWHVPRYSEGVRNPETTTFLADGKTLAHPRSAEGRATRPLGCEPMNWN